MKRFTKLFLIISGIFLMAYGCKKVFSLGFKPDLIIYQDDQIFQPPIGNDPIIIDWGLKRMVWRYDILDSLTIELPKGKHNIKITPIEYPKFYDKLLYEFEIKNYPVEYGDDELIFKPISRYAVLLIDTAYIWETSLPEYYKNGYQYIFINADSVNEFYFSYKQGVKGEFFEEIKDTINITGYNELFHRYYLPKGTINFTPNISDIFYVRESLTK